MADLLKITNDNFTEVVSSSDIAIINFSAHWCGPCRMFTPILEELADSKPEISVGKVATDEEMDLSSAYEIRSIPTTVVFKGGKEVHKFMGAQPMSYLENILKEL